MHTPRAHGLEGQLLEQRQLFKEVVDDLLAVHKGLPVSQSLGQLLGLVLEVVDLLCHGVNLLNNVNPEEVTKAANGGNNRHIKPAHK